MISTQSLVIQIVSLIYFFLFFFFFNAAAATEIYTLSLHDALPISRCHGVTDGPFGGGTFSAFLFRCRASPLFQRGRSEEHTSELQSHHDLVCRLLLEKKKDQYRELQPGDG